MNLQALFICLALVKYVVAVTFVSPTRDASWTSTGWCRISLKLFHANAYRSQGPNLIVWTSSNDTTAFANIQLLHNNNTTFQPIPSLLTADGLLATGIDVAAREFFVIPYCIPGHPSLPLGAGYSLQMFSEMPDGTKTTLAVTNGTFSIVAGQPITCPSFSTSTTSGTSSSSQSTGTATTSVSPSVRIPPFVTKPDPSKLAFPRCSPLHPKTTQEP
ncbi:hypothetical protein PILCRDRAFT_15022 [Piloderma croceum F 1598]|uniref:Uncharacterized protein n=1 Tax=Piloderma croceum (strain F 1598) TaxID=765440 RepID=A0A0C3AIS8_PILCF|nr:hypothetical protein PILCRDRAFT_15022 [Piloderma croceum F 1598]